MNVKEAIRQLRSGAITYDDLKNQFEQAKFKVMPPAGDVATAYERAESLPLDTDAPSLLNIADSTKTITPEQRRTVRNPHVNSGPRSSSGRPGRLGTRHGADS